MGRDREVEPDCVEAGTGESAAAPAEDPLKDVLDRPARLGAHPAEAGESADGSQCRIDGVVIGSIVRLGSSGEVAVEYPGAPVPTPLSASAAATFTPNDLGKPVALLFAGGDPSRPIAIGLVRNPEIPASATGPSSDPVEVTLDGETVTLAARKEIVLRVGEASITLTRSGKILIDGAYVSTKSSGVNRIRGGSVQVN